VLLFYTIGYLGGAAFKRKHGLSWGPFLVFFLIFNFNGYLASHLAVGHVVWWTGYFLLPWFFLLVLEWVETGPSLRISLQMSLVAFGMTLSGSFHFFNWCVIFVWLMALGRLGWLKYAAAFTGAGVLLSAYRVLPALVAFRSNWHVIPCGYPSFGGMWTALASIRPPQFPCVNGTGWWEYDMWVGLSGLAVLLVFGVLPLVPGLSRDRRFSKLGLPLAGMAALSFGGVWWWVQYGVPVLAGAAAFPYRAVEWWVHYVIPLLAVERVVSRMLILPVVLLAMLSAIRLERLRRAAAGRRVFDYAVAGVLVILALGFAWHSWTWRVEALAAAMPGSSIAPASPAIVTKHECAYAASVCAGWIATFAALAAAFLTARRDLHRIRAPGTGPPAPCRRRSRA
jgi:hypothetical protein